MQPRDGNRVSSESPRLPKFQSFSQVSTFREKRVTIGPSIQYRGDFVGFMDQAREFFADKVGLKADQQGPIVVLEEQRKKS